MKKNNLHFCEVPYSAKIILTRNIIENNYALLYLIKYIWVLLRIYTKIFLFKKIN